MQKVKKYRSRIGPLIWSITWIIVIGVFYFTVKPAFLNPTITYIILLAIIWIPPLIFLIGLMLGVKYLINSNQLIIKICHITHRKISIAKILSIKRSFNPKSSPANSLKRLSIRFTGGEVLVSPTNEQNFIEHLLKLNPKIELIDLGVSD